MSYGPGAEEGVERNGCADGEFNASSDGVKEENDKKRGFTDGEAEGLIDGTLDGPLRSQKAVS